MVLIDLKIKNGLSQMLTSCLFFAFAAKKLFVARWETELHIEPRAANEPIKLFMAAADDQNRSFLSTDQ